ncbi:MAG TPA: CHRD domain-containing protein [Thermoanaerobaculia bacterium]
MRTLSALSLVLVLVLVAVPAQAVTTMAAALNGANERPTPGDPDGSGFALVIVDPDAGTVRYALFVANIGAPTAAHIHRGTSDVAGPVVVNFNPSFTNGAAAGTVTTGNSALLNEIVANPGGFYVNVHNGDFPAGAVRGQLVAAASDATDAVFPIVGRAQGANNTFYRTDIALLNRSGEDTSVVLEFYPAGGSGNNAPSRVAAVDLDAGEQRTFIGDELQNLFGLGDGLGAIRVIAPRHIMAVGRIYNDQRTVGAGTFSQFVPSQGGTQNRTTGTLPMLVNAAATTAATYRTNIGWFNSSGGVVSVTWQAHGPNGNVLATTTRSVAARAQEQIGLNNLFPSLGTAENVYLTFTTTGGPLYVYASVVDNTNGDAIFIPVQ